MRLASSSRHWAASSTSPRRPPSGVHPYGIPQANGLRCAYHGWTYNSEGQVVDMPFEPACLPLKIAAYPVETLGGLIWAYLGPREKMPLFPISPLAPITTNPNSATQALICATLCFDTARSSIPAARIART